MVQKKVQFDDILLAYVQSDGELNEFSTWEQNRTNKSDYTRHFLQPERIT